MEDEKKPFACGECSKRFARKGTLKTHQLIHSGEKPYQCKFCDKSFRQPANLNFHVSRYHQEFAPPEKKPKKARENESSSSKTSPQNDWNQRESAKKSYLQNQTKTRISTKDKLDQQKDHGHHVANLVDFSEQGRMDTNNPNNGYGVVFDSSRESEEFRYDCGSILRELVVPNGTIDGRKNVQNEFDHAYTKPDELSFSDVSSSAASSSRNILMTPPVDNFPTNFQFELVS